MDEFIVKATLEEGEKINLLVFGQTVEEVVDNLVQMDTVKRVEEVIRKRDGAKWHLNDRDAISKLRTLRSQIKDEVLLKNVLTGMEGL
tara:strand:+ start:1562 stop:1825 length:264 start_codon:yes stop_codon:yes gene_type:complete